MTLLYFWLIAGSVLWSCLRFGHVWGEIKYSGYCGEAGLYLFCVVLWPLLAMVVSL